MSATDPGARFDDEQRACAFGAVAEAYARGRPGYPPDAVRWAVGDALPGAVLDLGAGTGKLTEALAALPGPPAVVAVEPDPAMRARIAEAAPAVQVLAGSAEALPLADASVDAVVAGQAWHWFDGARVGPEVARVLRRGGSVGALWNRRDEREQWLARYGDIVGERYGTATWRPAFAGIRDAAGFAAVEDAEFAHVVHLPPAGLVAMAASHSFVALLPAAERAAVLAKVERLAEEVAGTAGLLALPLRVVAVRARRR